MTEKINIGLVEDQLLFRQGIKAIISYWNDLEVIFESEDGYSVIEKLKKATVIPDVMLVDLSLPPNGHQKYGGIELTQDLLETFPEAKILILSAHHDAFFISQLIEKGAHGYLIKDSDPQEVYNAIVSVHTNGSYINERTLKAIQGRLGGKVKANKTHEQLTRREEEVLQLICQQLTTEEISEKLFISPKTVTGHRNNLLQKTNSRNVTGLVMFAIKHHFVEVV